MALIGRYIEKKNPDLTLSKRMAFVGSSLIDIGPYFRDNNPTGTLKDNVLDFTMKIGPIRP